MRFQWKRLGNSIAESLRYSVVIPPSEIRYTWPRLGHCSGYTISATVPHSLSLPVLTQNRSPLCIRHECRPASLCGSTQASRYANREAVNQYHGKQNACVKATFSWKDGLKSSYHPRDQDGSISQRQSVMLTKTPPTP